MARHTATLPIALFTSFFVFAGVATADDAAKLKVAVKEATAALNSEYSINCGEDALKARGKTTPWVDPGKAEVKVKSATETEFYWKGKTSDGIDFGVRITVYGANGETGSNWDGKRVACKGK